MVDFDKEWARAAKRLMKKQDKVFNKAAIEVSSNIVDRTPVGNPSVWKGQAPKGYTPGALKGNWTPSKKAPINIDRPSRKDKSGSKTKGRIKRTFSGLGVKDTLYLSNSRPYASVIEDGHSRTQAPSGMVKISLLSWTDIVRKWAKKIKL